MSRPVAGRWERALWALLPAVAVLSITGGQLLAAVLIAHWIWSGRDRAPWGWPPGLRVSLLAFLGWTVVAGLVAPDSIPGGTGKWLVTLLIPAGWAHVRAGGDPRWALLGLLAAAVAILPFGAIRVLHLPEGRAEAFSGGAPHLGSNLMMGLVIAVSLALGAWPRRQASVARVMAVAAAIVCVIGLGLTQNRAAAAGAVVGISVVTARTRPVLVAAGLIIAASLLAARPEMPPVVRLRAGLLQGERDTSRERLRMWWSGLRMVRDRPLLGFAGRGAFIAAYESDYRAPDAHEPRPGHVHQSLLQAAVLHGVPGLGLLGWWLAVLLRLALGARDGPAIRWPLAPALLPLLAVVLVNAQFDFVLADGQHAMLWTVLTGLLLGACRYPKG